MNKIGAVIVDYKAYEQVNETVNMLLEMAIFSKIVVVDNSLDFNTNKYVLNDVVEIIYNKQNIGYGSANNTGIKKMLLYNMDYVVLINFDIKISKKSLLRCIESADDSHPIVSCVMRNPDGDIDQSFWNKMKYADFLSLLFVRKATKYINSRKQYCLSLFEDNSNRMVDVDCVRESFMVLNLNYVKQNGPLFDNHLFMFYEADTIGYDLFRRGKRALVLLDESYYHHHRYSETKFKYDKRYNESAMFVLKNYLKVNWIKLLLYRFLAIVSILERYIVFLLVKMKHGIIHR